MNLALTAVNNCITNFDPVLGRVLTTPPGSRLSMLVLELENVLFRLAGTCLRVYRRYPDFSCEQYLWKVHVSGLEMVYFQDM